MDLLHGDLETSEYNSLFVLEIFVRAFCASVIPIELSRLQKRTRVKLVETRFLLLEAQLIYFKLKILFAFRIRVKNGLNVLKKQYKSL